jgi:HlyD family secretion protein
LKASRDGVVSRILLRPGDVVPAGTPIVRIVSPSSNRIYGFIPEPRPAYHLHVGDTALVWRRAHGDRKFRAVVTAIEPEFDPLPGRVSPIQGQPLRGRRVVVDLLEPHDLVPGETVQLSGWAGMRWPWERWMR